MRRHTAKSSCGSEVNLRPKNKDTIHGKTLGLPDTFLLLIMITFSIDYALLWPVVDLASQDDARLLIKQE
jgi:hypothetical protein